MPSYPIRVIAKSLLPGWIAAGFSAAESFRKLQAVAGGGYRRTEWLADYREAKGVVVNEIPIAKMRMETPIPRNVMIETELRRPRRYLIKARASFEGAKPGEIIERHISWYTETAQSKEQLIDEYLEKLAPKKYEDIELPFEIRIRAIHHNIGMDY